MTASGDDPVFLVGAPRSGTSALYKALCLHADVAYISNWVRRWPAVPQLAALNRVAARLPGARLRAWFGGGDNAYVYGGHRPWWERALPMPVEGEPVYARCGIPAVPTALDAWGEREVVSLRSAFAAVRRYSGGRRLVSKRIANNLRIPLLSAAFPGARFVEIVRDGRAVAYSLSRVDWWPDSVVWWYGGTPRQWEADGGDPWELCARAWVEEVRALEKGLGSVPGDQVLSVRYERFVAEPVTVLHEVAAFAGLPALEGWQRSLSELRFPDRNDAWGRGLGPEAVGVIERVQADDLRRHGYDV